ESARRLRSWLTRTSSRFILAARLIQAASQRRQAAAPAIDKNGALRSTAKSPIAPRQVAMPDIHALLWPRHVALIGASADAEGLRGRIMRTLAGHPFQRQIYPATRSDGEMLGRKAYATIADVPEPPDLAVLIIPAQFIPQELERCGRLGVRAAVVLSSGFAEAGGNDGTQLQAEIRAIARH